jgi:hypothetical protein
LNANELADCIKIIYTDNPLAPTQLFIAVETMLRQQQAEIEALKAELKLIDELVRGKYEQ